MDEKIDNVSSKKSSPKVRKAFLRAFLRTISTPFLPGPELYDLLQEIRNSRSDLDKQVSKAVKSLKQSSELVSRLENGLEQRSAKLKELQEEYNRYSELSEIEEKKVEALIKQLEDALGTEFGKERRFTIIINIIFFVAGGLLSWGIRIWFF